MKIKMSKKEVAINLILIVSIILIAGKTFYGSFTAGIILLPLGIPIFLNRKRKIRQKRMEELEKQFKDMLVSVSDALATGYSLENALQESYRDLVNMYGYDCEICKELRLALSRIKLNISIEKALEEFANRLQLENAMDFSRILFAAKRTGGSIREIIKDVTDDIVLRQMVKDEISVAISEKNMEKNIMTFIPICLLAFVNLSSKGFFDIMYYSIWGKVIMTICLLVYVGAYFWSEKIVEIEV